MERGEESGEGGKTKERGLGEAERETGLAVSEQAKRARQAKGERY